MSWGEIKHALNGSLGTSWFKPLDEMVRDVGYNNLYLIAKLLAHLTDKIYISSSNVFGFDESDGFLAGAVYKEIFLSPFAGKVKENSITSAFFPHTTCTVYIPSSIKELGANAFNHNNIVNTIIYEGLEKIGAQAFRQARERTFYLPSTVQEIGANAFPAASTIYVAWEEGKVSGAPWGASKVIYNNKHPW